jgi:nucleotide-binding universal stress UspA family protein
MEARLEMFNTIVWATDGSPHADRALEYATQLAQRENAPLHVVHVVEKFAGGRAAGQDQRADEAEIEAKIERQAANLRDEAGVDVHVHMPRTSGSAAKRIAQLSEHKHADVIVVGTRGRSAVTGAFLGSVTQQLLHIVHCPVIAVPPLGQSSSSTADVDELATAG